MVVGLAMTGRHLENRNSDESSKNLWISELPRDRTARFQQRKQFLPSDPGSATGTDTPWWWHDNALAVELILRQTSQAWDISCAMSVMFGTPCGY